MYSSVDRNIARMKGSTSRQAFAYWRDFLMATSTRTPAVCRLQYLNLYPNGNAFALNGGLPLDYNISPAIAARITPEFLYNTFGGSNQFGF